jgi:hypothetical protein
MKCVILQPSYIPWRGFFDQIRKTDVFVFYDDVQYDKHGWRNRNRIKTHQGPVWLTIPVYKKGVVLEHTPINQIKIDWSTPWNRKHWMSIQQSYGKAPFFKQYAPQLEAYYSRPYTFLADFTIGLTMTLSRLLGISATQFIRSSCLEVTGTKTDRLLQILQKIGANYYISGPAAKDYLEEEKFEQLGIGLEYMGYHYPEYPQLYPPYDPQVSILDLLFMAGPDALKYFE